MTSQAVAPAIELSTGNVPGGGVTELWFVRHGESLANVAGAQAKATGEQAVLVDLRDADVPITALGRQQSRALGRELERLGVADVPVAYWTSPYRRARDTLEIALEAAGIASVAQRVDERLRDVELGILESLTLFGIQTRHPAEFERRVRLGRFYYRPPGGESFVDVMLRLRSLMRDVDRTAGASRLVIAAHDSVVMLAVALCLGLDEESTMGLSADGVVANASLTRLRRLTPAEPWVLEQYAGTDHLAEIEKSPGGALGTQRGLLFDLDGVLTPTAEVHMRAWARLFAPFLESRGAAPYSEQDYFAYIDGKPRYDGVLSLLESRGLAIPEGLPTDSSEQDTVCGLGNRKNAAFTAELHESGVQAYPGSAAFVDAAIHAGYSVAVVSSSANARSVLAAAGMLDLFPHVVDAPTAAVEGLAGKPAADTYLAAAERLGLSPAECVVIEDAISGVEAGRNGHFGLVVGVDRGVGAGALREHGADVVVEDLSQLIPALVRVHDRAT